MKKRLALFMTVILVLSLLPMNVFAATKGTLYKSVGYIPGATLLFETSVYSGGLKSVSGYDGINYYVGGSDLVLEVIDEVVAGEEFRFTLSNAEFFFNSFGSYELDPNYTSPGGLSHTYDASKGVWTPSQNDDSAGTYIRNAGTTEPTGRKGVPYSLAISPGFPNVAIITVLEDFRDGVSVYEASSGYEIRIPLVALTSASGPFKVRIDSNSASFTSGTWIFGTQDISSIRLGNASNGAEINLTQSGTALNTYSATVANGVSSVSLEVESDKTVTFTLNGAAYTGSTDRIPLVAGRTNVVEIIPENGATYTLNIYRQAPAENTGGSSNGGSGNGSSGRGSSGGSNSDNNSTTTPPTSTSSNNPSENEKTVESLLNTGSPVEIQMSSNSDTVTLNASTMERLLESGQPLTIKQGGLTVTIDTATMEKLLQKDGNIVFNIKPLDNETVANLVKSAIENGGVLAAGILDINISVGGEAVKEFPTPLEVNIDITASELAKGQIEKLSGVRLNDDGTIDKLGGTYDPKAKKFKFFTSKTSLYSVMFVDDLLSLFMKLDSKGYTLNSKKQEFDVAPVIQNDRALVPVRLIAESFGADVGWDEARKTVTINLDSKKLELTIGKRLPGMDVEAVIIDNRAMVPIRYISEYFGANVVYDDATRTIAIYK